MATRTQQELKGLTGLRGVAALTVFISHSRFQDLAPALEPVAGFFEWHAMAVDLFFMLSGFVLMHVYSARLGSGEKRAWSEYFAARMARIYPLYLVTLAATMGIFFAGSLMLKKWPSYLGGDVVLTNVLLAQNWPGLFERSINMPAWSLSVEIVCYVVLMPVLLFLESFLSKSAVILLVVVLLCWRTSFESPVDGWGSLGRGLTCFLSGGLLHRFHGRLPGRMLGNIALLGMVLFVILQSWVAWGGMAMVWPLVSFPLLVLGLAAPVNSLAHRVFESRPMLWLGNISYSLYLWHSPVAMITLYYVRPRLGQASSLIHVVWMGVEVIFILMLSHFSFRRLEMPLRTWCRRRLRLNGGRMAPVQP